MNPAFLQVIGATNGERRDLFLAGATRLGTTAQNVEKDFWVCRTLDVLFNGLAPGGPRLLFKGGTSLSKAYGLIARFSEDIDVTVFRADIGEPASIEELEALSGKKRAVRLDAIKAACQAYIRGPFLTELARIAEQTMRKAGTDFGGEIRIASDDGDPDGQSLLLWYPSAAADGGGYVRPAVKIESGVKSALDPHASMTVKPYVADEMRTIDLSVANVTTVDAERTFWDKVVILHGLRRWYERRSELRGGSQRVSRHYYDVHCLLQSDVGVRAIADAAMATNCVRHALRISTNFRLMQLTPPQASV